MIVGLVSLLFAVTLTAMYWMSRGTDRNPVAASISTINGKDLDKKNEIAKQDAAPKTGIQQKESCSKKEK